MFIAIMNWDSNNHPIKYQTIETQVEADQFVSDRAGVLPGTRADAFVVPAWVDVDEYIIVDPVAKTINVDTVGRDANALSVTVKSIKAAINALKEQKKDLPILSEGFQVDTDTLSSSAMTNTLFAFGSKTMVISSLTFSGGTVTAVTIKNHHMINAQIAAITLAVEVDYNGSFPITIIDKRTFTYAIAGSPSSPATGVPIANAATIPWFDNLGTQRFWSLETFDDISRDILKYLQDLTIHGNTLREAVDAATTVAEVEAIDITTGWPDTGI